MSQDLEVVLRKALDDADSYRKRVVVVSFLLAGVVVGGLGWLDHLRQTSDIKTMLFFGVVTLLIAQVHVAVVTWGVVTTMTRKTLKAIELMSKD